MAYDLTGRALHPLGELIDIGDFPLADFLPSEALQSTFDGIYFSEAEAAFCGENFVLTVRLAIEAELVLAPPGSDAVQLVLCSGSSGWTSLLAEIVLGPDFGITLRDVTLGVRVAKEILEDVATGGPAEISVSADITFSRSAIEVANGTGAALPPCKLCGTNIVVAAQDVRPVFGPIEPPDFLVEQPDFQGIALTQLKVRLPPEFINTDPGANLDITLANAAIGTTGFTGRVSVTSDPARPVTGTLIGFPFRFRQFTLDIHQNAFVDVSLGADMRLAPFEDGAAQKWVAFDFVFGAGGDFSGALAGAQPAGAATTPGALVEFEFQKVVRFDIRKVRITKVGAVWALYFSGDAQVLLEGAVTWPKVAFDEIGVDSTGALLLPDGAGISFATPLVVDWHFVRLTVPKFRFGYASEDRNRLQLALAAEVVLHEEIPAGASVEGLVVEWQRGQAPSVSFTGIGVKFGVPGSFEASLAVAYVESNGVVEFRGQGALDLTSLDVSVDVAVVIGRQSAAPPDHPEAFTYLYVLADAKVLPTGIPIGSTGLSIYGFQGLVATNMALAIDAGLPADERYYELFTRAPIGITSQDKWLRRKGEHALGVGVVLGTADKGYALNVKGLLVVAFPDLTILLQARANFLKQRPALEANEEGALDALLVYASGQSTLTIDILAHWGIPELLSVDVAARACFSFTDPNAWYLEIGRDESGKRAVAKVLKWHGDWLFNAGSWFRLDKSGVVTGIKIDVSLEAEKGGFWVEAEGHARGTMTIFWQPSQWEGTLSLSGRIGAGYRGVSVSIELAGDARARVRRPFDVLIKVDACVDLKLKTVCKSFDFDWKESAAPQLESPIRRWNATPRHFTPYSLPEVGANRQEHGVAKLTPGTAAEAAATPLVAIHPHSILSLDFAKSMVDATGVFNEAVELDDDGFLTVGKKSGWSATYRIDAIEVRRDPDGANEPIELWGTWAAETLERNTTLRIFSSERFGEEGSRTKAFAELLDLDYCAEAKKSILCVPLEDVRPGYGWLSDGSLYYYPATTPRGQVGGSITLAVGERIEVLLPRAARNVRISPGRATSSVGPARRWLASLCAHACANAVTVLVAVVLAALALVLFLVGRSERALLVTSLILDVVAMFLLIVGWLCTCRRSPAGPNDSPGPPQKDSPAGSGGSGPGGDVAHPGTPLEPGPGGIIVIDSGTTNGVPLGELCYEPGYGTPVWDELATRGGSKTDREAWSVPAQMLIFRPQEVYELRVSHTALLKKSDGTITTPLGAPTVTCARFETLGPPDRADALRDYVASAVPLEGARPVYTGYDVSLTFLEPYVPYLYTAAGERLCLRLRDGQGQVLAGNDSNALLIPLLTNNAVEKTVTMAVWEDVYKRNVEKGCIEPDPIRTDAKNTLVVQATGSAAGFKLAPNSQYVAELVSDARANVPLVSWSFATSSYATFVDLVTRDRVVAPPRIVPAVLGSTFDELARSASLPTVRYVDRFTVTRLVNGAGVCLGLILEAPEPFSLTRLTVTVGGAAVAVVANVDETRLFVMPIGASWPAGSPLAVKLVYARDIGAAGPRLTVSGDATAEVVDFVVPP